ncbi:MAG: IspD/TarI family cytidylyltransferase, partial [Humibacter sp.]
MSIEPSPRVAVVIVGAGSGTRLGAAVPKAFVTAGGSALLEHAVHSVIGMSGPAQLIAVVPADLTALAADLISPLAPHAVVVAGGTTRQASVAAGLAVLDDAIEVVLVHDAARAFTPSDVFDAVVAAVDASGD